MGEMSLEVKMRWEDNAMPESLLRSLLATAATWEGVSWGCVEAILVALQAVSFSLCVTRALLSL